MQTRCVQIANTVFHSCHQCDNIDRLNKYKQQITNNLQLYSCARSQHAHANWVNWLNIITNYIISYWIVLNLAAAFLFTKILIQANINHKSLYNRLEDRRFMV